MYSFIFVRKPKSHNSFQKDSTPGRRYKEALTEALAASCPNYESSTQDMYGLVYHFYTKYEGFDADNLSKPIWDCLCNELYNDDRQVKLRVAGSFNLLDASYDFKSLNFTGLSGDLIASLLDAFETESHILYIECGVFNSDMIRLNLAENAN
ncbi:MAG: RusA family crossover junction endodeoxyribonuclease [Cytophagaceae bacterium]|nr:MAG: RusA family crossover junction endodeoxyribonuclease [Cytophagaceae bacterium]